ncbi:MAG TPA: chemotaxis protein CheB [Myxococcales bacterium]|jgi:two-component system chemotaxis response regulator CheB|nr:chemotaxis protein CheB [Myxococcales bacterium]
MIRTLVADDSPAFREALTQVLREDPDFHVVGGAADGAEAVEQARLHRPDLIVMDVVMPGMSGLVATAEIMSVAPCAVVVMSRLMDTSAQQVAFEALRAGAVEVMGKPRDLGNARTKADLRQLLKAMSHVKVVRRRSHAPPLGALAPDTRYLAVGASTGGPPALREILRHLPAAFPGTVLVAQHLASGFIRGLRRWLEDSIELDVEIVEDRCRVRPGCVYLPVDDRHLVLEKGEVASLPAPGESPVPNVNRLFASLLDESPNACAVLLTGMGSDGAEGLKLLHDRGCHTIIQDEDTSLIYGMPRVAKELGAAVEELPLHAIGPRLRALFGQSNRGTRPT